jgi:hypothetical protein
MEANIDEIILGEIYEIKYKNGIRCIVLITPEQKLYKKEYKIGYYITYNGICSLYKHKPFEMLQITDLHTMEPSNRRGVLYIDEFNSFNSFIQTKTLSMFITECKLYFAPQDAALLAMKNAACADC